MTPLGYLRRLDRAALTKRTVIAGSVISRPTGYALGIGGTMDHWWFALLVGTALKGAIIHYAGVRGFRQAAPFFMGLVLGQYAELPSRSCSSSLLWISDSWERAWGWQRAFHDLPCFHPDPIVELMWIKGLAVRDQEYLSELATEKTTRQQIDECLRPGVVEAAQRLVEEQPAGPDVVLTRQSRQGKGKAEGQ